MKKRYLEAGKIVTTFGIGGEVKADVWGDAPDFLTGFSRLYFDFGKNRVEVERARVHKNAAVLKLKGIDTVEEAVKLRGKTLYIDREDVELPEESFFIQDLIGLSAIDVDSGEEYGVLSQVSQTGANDVYHIKSGDKEYLVPAVEAMVPKIDVEGGKIYLRPIKGIFDDDN